MSKPYDFNQYAAGKKVYGFGNPAPNTGPVADRFGYRERDRNARLRRNALLRRMQQLQKGNYTSPEVLRGPVL